MKKVRITTKKPFWTQERQFCNYVHRVCMQSRLEGYNYCIRHILEDKAAPFRQCNFVHMQSGQRCTNAAPKNEKKECFLCPWHAKIAQRSRIMNVKRSNSTMQNPQLLLEVLEEHCTGPHQDQSGTLSGTHGDKSAARLLDVYESCSESESDCESALHNFLWKREPDSDPESSDSEQQDPLKHAGVYTAEEASLILRDKLVRLQSLYLDQFKRLQHIWKEKRNKYLQAMKLEENTESSLSKSKEHKQNQKLKAYKHYHRPHGNEAVLQWRLYQKRQNSSKEGKMSEEVHTASGNPALLPKCHYRESGATQCTAPSLPYTKYCSNHILHDSHQMLYKRCQPDCPKPVTPVTPTCLLHTVHIGAPSELLNSISDTWTVAGSSGSATRLADFTQEPELFQTMDDIAALGLDVVQPGSLFGLNQFGEFGESTDSSLAADMTALNEEILSGAAKTTEKEVEIL